MLILSLLRSEGADVRYRSGGVFSDRSQSRPTDFSSIAMHPEGYGERGHGEKWKWKTFISQAFSFEPEA